MKKPKKCYRQAITNNLDYAKAHNNLGVTLHHLDRFQEAETSCRQAITLDPELADAHNNLGIVLSQLNRLEEAEICFKQAIDLHHDFYEAYNNLSLSLLETGKLEEAEEVCLRAITLNSHYADAYNSLGLILKELHRFEDSESSFNKAITLKPRSEEFYNNLAGTLTEVGKIEGAEAAYITALALNPRSAVPYLNLCDFYEKLNRIEDALPIIERAEKKSKDRPADIDFFRALFSYRQEKSENLHELLAKVDIGALTKERVPSYLKLKADWLHDQREYDSAFDSFSLMNEATKNSKGYKQGDANFFLEKQRSKVVEIRSLQAQKTNTADALSIWTQPTFLIGFPRSGTTLLDTILRGHSQIEVAEEKPMVEKVLQSIGSLTSISDIENIDVERARTVYLEEFERHLQLKQESITIDKFPLNILELPLIHKIFPTAKFILALRHPFDCILSCWMQNFKLNPAMANMVDLNLTVDLYCLAMEILTLSKNRYGLNVHKIRYESLVNDLETEVSSLLTFLNLNWEEELRDFQKTAYQRGVINTPSYSQVVKPLYETATYRWKNYEQHLGQYNDQLEPWFKEYGYL